MDKPILAVVAVAALVMTLPFLVELRRERPASRGHVAYAAIAGLFFATFLIVQQASVFCGLMRWTTATLKNVGAPIFVVEERVEQVLAALA